VLSKKSFGYDGGILVVRVSSGARSKRRCFGDQLSWTTVHAVGGNNGGARGDECNLISCDDRGAMPHGGGGEAHVSDDPQV
jgi:hypothetical protein